MISHRELEKMKRQMRDLEYYQVPVDVLLELIECYQEHYPKLDLPILKFPDHHSKKDD